jgi:MFS family permease
MADPAPTPTPQAGGSAGQGVPAGVGDGLRLVGRSSGVGISAGCLTAIGTLLALFLGMWLDGQLGTRPMFTLGFVLASVPLSLIVMTWWVLREARRIAAERTAPESPPPIVMKSKEDV